jgi:putative FmdB family regulatory protein
MPIYEYACQKCGKTFEYMQSMSDKPKRKCEACGGKLEKLISATSFRLEGSGWYKDLYASPKPGGGASDKGDAGDARSEAKSGDKPASKPEVKPEPKPDKKPKAAKGETS